MTACRVLIIGRSGQLARALVRAAETRNVEVEPVGRPMLDLGDIAGARAWLRGRLQAPDRPDIIINAAAFTAVDAAESRAEQANRINAEAPAMIAAACAKADLPLIHVSTDYVFSGAKRGAWVEDDPTQPRSVYGRTKLAGEAAVANSCEKHLIVRTSWLFSATPPNFMTTMIRLARERREISVVEDQIGTPTPAAALASALLTMSGRAQDDSAPWGLYHFGGDTVMSWAGFAERILATAGLTGCAIRPIPGSKYPTDAERPAWSALDSSRLAAAFGCPPADFNVGLADAVREHLDAH